jgi:hypothetical protein
MSWIESLTPSTTLDLKLRLAATLALLLWNFALATSLETPYPDWLVNAYALPLTRLFLLTLVILSSMWCPTVGIMAAFAYICLGADVLTTTKTTGV